MENEPEEPPQKEAVYAKFLGGATRYWDGVPARDLTKAEWDEITSNVQNHLLHIEMYSIPKKAGKQ